MATGKRSSGASPLTRLRAICLALPEAHEVEAWGAPTFRVRNKQFAMFAAEGNHHTAGRPSVWVKAAPGNQPFMVAHAPKRFFVPPYVGPSGWVGVYLDEVANWDELPELLADAWRLTAPKRLAAAFEAGGASAPAPSAKRAAKTPAKSAVKKPAKKAVKKPAKPATAKKATRKTATKSAKKSTPTKKTPTKKATKRAAAKRRT